MTYLAHFSYESRVDPQTRIMSDWHGYFTCVTEAEFLDQALKIFEALLRRLAHSTSVFSDVEEVFLESCIEIKSVHRKGLLTFFKEMRGMSEGAISASLVGAESNRNVTAYQFGSRPLHEVQTMQPFVVFRP